MIRTMFCIALGAAALCAEVLAADIPVKPVAAPLATGMVNETIKLVETKGLYPRKQAEYLQAKNALLALVEGSSGEVDRKSLYKAIRKLLSTLDADGHSFFISADAPPLPESQAAPGKVPPPVFQLLHTANGTVLRWTPPAVEGTGRDLYPAYLKRFHEEAAARPEFGSACALVVDLSEQTGGNAWPPLIAMYPLFSETNEASWVDRDDKRTRFVVRADIEALHRLYGGNAGNPLTAFARSPIGVVASEQTASAGEMLLVALLGENGVRTFGKPSYGMTTANAHYQLADGSTLVLSESRYAVGDGPVFRGRIAPMHAVREGDTPETSVAAAAEWVAAQSTRCRSAQH